MDPLIRFKLPKWQKILSKSWPKELLMTFIGATLSIILTFGTAHIVGEKEKKEDGRQAAMMVIHDMDNTAEILEGLAKKEESNFNMAQHVFNNVATIDDISIDTLWSVADYLVSSGETRFNLDDSSEKVFLSSQDNWKNINNPAFIDAVQEFYHERRIIYDNFNKLRYFLLPIPEEEYYCYADNILDMQLELPQFLRGYADNKNVDFYITSSFVRRRYYNTYADMFRSNANRCKFMMGITDEELASYVESIKRVGKPLAEKKLIGKWQQQTTAELLVEYEFLRDHTYTSTIINYMSYAYYTGQLHIIYRMHGTWQLMGDSLITVAQPGWDLEVDRSAIKYQPDMEDVVNTTIENWEKEINDSEQLLIEDGEQRNAEFASVDATGNKIELRGSVRNEQGKDNYVVKYLMRKNH